MTHFHAELYKEPSSPLLESGRQIHYNALIWEALHCIPIGMLALTRNLQILRCNRSAQTVLDKRDGLHAYRGSLRAASAHETCLLLAAVRQVSRMRLLGNAPQASLVRIGRGSSEHDIEVLVRGFSTCAEGNSEFAAIAFVSDPSQVANPPTEILEQLHGLTPAEAQLARLLMNGQSLQEAAELLRIKKDTVRKHLQSIFSKTQTSRQGELVRLLIGGIARLEV